jgi:adenosylcobinamide-phosphate synthase
MPVVESLALLLAFALDAALGEPPNRVHPVALFGSLVSRILRLAPERGRIRQLAFGSALALVLPLGAAALVRAGLTLVDSYPAAALLITALMLKPTFALRALGEAGLGLADALDRGGAEAARPHLSSLCSRDPEPLDDRALAAAAVESLAENLSDSVIAPLFFFVLLGLPGAVFYRAVNTLDAMIGYRGKYEHLGKASARLDDLLNFVPARLTAMLLLLAGALVGADVRRGLLALVRDGRKTESPNAGRPMAAAAGLLGVALDKPGCYRLFAEGGDASGATIREAFRLVRIAACLGAALAVLSLGCLHG